MGPISISRDDVVYAYRLILGREPESDSAIINNMKGINDLLELRDRFMSSQEFKEKYPYSFFPLDIPKIEIDTDATESQLAAMIAKIKEAWSHLGETRPFFSVLTKPKFLPENFSQNSKEYWDSGEREAGLVRKMLERHGFDISNADSRLNPPNKICVEYGCGTGRVTMGLAGMFKQVCAYDISPGNMAYAKQRAQELGIDNIAFYEVRDALEDLQPCDFFYSRIVFQHNPPPLITRLIEKSLRSLNPGGIAIFQVPTYRLDYRFKIDEWLKTDHPLDMQMHCLPQSRIFEIISQEGCTPLEIREDGSSAPPISNTFVVRKNVQRTGKKRPPLRKG